MHLLEDVSTRLQQERKRIGLSQEAFGNEVGVSKRTQAGYEGGSNAPDALYLIGAARLGVDIAYVLFGLRSESSLSALEQQLLQLFRGSSLVLQAAAIGALEAGLKADRGVIVQGDVSGQVAGGDITSSESVQIKKQIKKR